MGRTALLVVGLVIASTGHVFAAPTAPPAPSTVHLAVVMFNMPGSPSFAVTPDDERDIYFGTGKSVATLYAEASHGSLVVTGRVFGPYTIAGDPSTYCDLSTWSAAARAAATSAGVDLTGYDHFAYVFPRSDACPWAGLGDLNGTNSYINAPAAGDVGIYHAAHELGHNLGADHAHALHCAVSGAPVSLTDDSQCSVESYGDPFSIMGSGIVRPPSAWERFQMGLLNPRDYQTIAANDFGTYSMKPLESGDTGTKLLLIERSAGGYLAVEYRTSTGIFPVFAGTTATAGILVHEIRDDITRASALVDATPGTSSARDGYFAAGSSLTDTADDVTLSFSAFSGSGATVVVSDEPQTQNATTSAPPPAAPTQLSAQVGANGIVNLSWSAVNSDTPVRYQILRAGRLAATVTATSYTTKKTITTATRFAVRSVDSLGQTSQVVALVATPVDVSAPSAVGGAWAVVQGPKMVTIQWTAATDDRAVTRYRVRFANGRTLFTTRLTMSFRRLTPGRHVLTVAAFDAAGKVGPETTVSFSL